MRTPKMTFLQLLTPRQLPPKVDASPSGSVLAMQRRLFAG